MWRALLLSAILAAGCGDTSDAGMTDASGCPVRLEDWKGTATLEGTCPGAPATLDLSGGITGTDGSNPGHPSAIIGGVDPTTHTCNAYVNVSESCGTAMYVLKIPQR